MELLVKLDEIIQTMLPLFHVPLLISSKPVVFLWTNTPLLKVFKRTGWKKIQKFQKFYDIN